MTTKSINKNHSKPLESLTIEVKGDPVPALSSFFVEARPMVPFCAPPKVGKGGEYALGAKDSWFQKMELYKSNMEWLLGLSHHKFWSQIVYGADTWDAVISFLQEAYPYYAVDGIPEDQDIRTIYNKIYYLVYYVVKRAMTKNESETNYIGKKYGSLLYNYTIISVPMMIDICVLYGERFQRDTAEMISNVFTVQPLYEKDLENSVQSIKTAFCMVEEKFVGRSLSPSEITKLIDKPRPVKRLTVTALQDVVFYLLDISASLTTFAECYAPAALILHKHKFETCIARLYDNSFPSAVRQVQDCCDNDEAMSLYFTLMFKLNNARFFFIKLFRLCIQAALNIMFSKQTEVPGSQAYLDVMTECLSFSIFMKDYHSKFPIDHDLDAIAQNCPDFDSIKYNFLLESLLACFDNAAKQASSSSQGPKPKNSVQVAPLSIQSTSSTENTGFDNLNVEELRIEELTCRISEVKDCLPHLGDGFIQKCLEHFNMSPSAVINAVLENTLPDEVKDLDTDLPFIPPETSNSMPAVFDINDDENMYQAYEEQYLAHKGKRQDRERELKQVLDDKSFRNECSSRFSQLGIIESLDNIYDDEYDDTYDDSELPVPEVEEPDRKFVVPRVLQQGRKKNEASESNDEFEEEEESEEQKRQKSYHNFVENPEDVRARYQQKRLENMKHPPGPKKDVIGNPKGQGQEKNVLRNRQQKTVNKSSNRKKAAQFKKSKGMF